MASEGIINSIICPMQENSSFILKIPYFITIIAIFSPLVGAVFRAPGLERMTAEVLLILVYLVLLIKDKAVFKITYRQLLLYSMLCLIFIYGLFRENEFGMYGLYSIFLMILIYVNIFRRYGDIWSVRLLYRQVTVVLLINIVFILFENMANLSGAGAYLVDLTNQRYRLDLSAPLSYFNLVDFSSANSLFLKAQAASLILGISMYWFLDPFNVKKQFYKNSHYKLLFVLTTILYIIQFTTASMVVMLIMLMVSIFIFPRNKINYKLSKGGMFSIMLLLSPLLYKVVFFKFDGFAIDQVYLDVALNPFEVISNLDTETLLFGVGGFSGNNSLVDFYKIESADFGLLMVLIMGGVFIFSLAAISLMIYFNESISMLKKEWLGERHAIVAFLATLVIIVLGLTISIGHYTNILQPGGRHAYAFLISISLFLIYLVKNSKIIR
jgi:hypothetical protein